MRRTVRTLPITELANNCSLPRDTQIERLERFRQPTGPLPSYRLSKGMAPEALGAGTAMLPGAPALRGEHLYRQLLATAKGDAKLATFNWPVVAALAAWSDENGCRAIHREMDAVPVVGRSRKDLLCNVIVAREDQGTLITLDPRRTNGLTAHGILVLQSLIHHLVREQFPDLADFDITVLQFKETNEDLEGPARATRRRVFENTLGSITPIDWSTLEAGIAETLAIYDELAAPQPMKATGTDDLFSR